ncbi:MAG: heme-binding protein [Opitutae bacterium]|nr:heme-binding protein [Opitutae bacterium]
MKTLYLLPLLFAWFFSASLSAVEITKISASGAQQGNDPVHAIDTNPGTRWSSEGKGQWLQLELDGPLSFAEFEAGFSRGNRRYEFSLETSADGKKWHQVFSGKSHGQGDGIKKFPAPAAAGRFLRIVSQGNNENKWVNLHTFRIQGLSLSKKLVKAAPPVHKDPSGLEVSVWAENPLVASPVAISFDEQGRAYVTRVRRRKISSLDLRNHRAWVKHDLSIRSLEDKLAFYQKAMGPNTFPDIRPYSPPDRNADGKRDWRDLGVQKEEILRIEDTDGDGKADKMTPIDQDLSSPVMGIAAGVLWAEGAAYAAVEPDIWKYDDSNGDGIPDKRTLISRGYSIHIGQGGHNVSGLTMGPDGRIYWSVADKGINATGKDGERFFYPDRGAIMRCEPDGSRLEVFALGVRNGQEPVFDEFGNLFSVDNDGDYRGERERFIYIVEGGMTAWRLHWQWYGYQDFAKVSGEKPYNVWMEEGLFRPRFPGQAAFIVPPLASYSNGPCGFVYDPGTALNEKFRKSFFLAQGRSITAFKVRPKGAAFEMFDEQRVPGCSSNTGLTIGPDGALYVTDWMNGPSERGRVWKIDDPRTADSPVRKRVRRILAEGMKKRSVEELATLLRENDLRIRKAAQFELVRRGGKGQEALLAASVQTEHRLARLHGLWGLGQVVRGWPPHAKANPDAVNLLFEFLSDKDEEVRAQVAKVLGESKHLPAANALIELLADNSIRVRFHAALALGKLQVPQAVKPLFALLAQNDDKDAFLRHAAVMGLVGATTANSQPLVDASKSSDTSIRLAAILALRRHAHPEITSFLQDEDLYLVTEVARAIHDDFSIPDALPALAEVLDRSDLKGEPLLRRAINANFRVGRPEDAARLARYAAKANAPENMRTTALACLALWPQPPVLDAVEGRYRKYPPRDPKPAAKALSKVADELVGSASAKVLTVLARAIERLKVTDLLPVVRAAYDSDKATAFLQAQLLGTMAELSDPALGEYVEVALESKDARLRAAAQKRAWAAGLSGIEVFAKALESGGLQEKRSALHNLAQSDDSQADALLAAQFAKLDPQLELDLLEAAGEARGKISRVKAKARQDELAAKGAWGSFLPTLSGGDAEAGRKVAFGHPAAQCIRCHKVGSSGGVLGPDLSKVSARLNPEKLLESLVNPQAELAEGYGLLVATLKDGSTVTGSITEATAETYALQSPDGKQFTLQRNLVASQILTSPMPPAGGILSKREIRDLLAFLSTLR